MQLPQANAAFIHFRRCTVHFSHQALAAGRKQLAEDARSVLSGMKRTQDAVEDAEDNVTVAQAERESADAVLDPAAEETTRTLGARSADAKKSAPWTLIFPDTVAYYTCAPVGEQVKRYTQLVDRMTAHLPAEDPLLTTVVPRVMAGLEQWKLAEAALSKATVALEAARGTAARAEEEWRSFMDRAYASLRAELGKEAAEHFFRKQSRRSGKEEG